MTQRGQSVATPERGTAPGKGKGTGLGTGRTSDCQPSLRSETRQHCEEHVERKQNINTAVSIQGPKGNESYRKKGRKSTQPIQTRLTIARRRQPECPEVHIANTMTTYKCHTERRGAPSFAERRPCQPLSHRAPLLCNFTEMEFTITKTLNPYRTKNSNSAALK